MEVVIQFMEATENYLDVLNDPQSSWKYDENMYYMNIQSKYTLLKSILSASTYINLYSVHIKTILSFCGNDTGRDY